MTIVRTILTKLPADNPVAAIRRDHRHFLAKLMMLSRLTFADAFYFRLVQTVANVLVAWPLGVQAFAPRE